MATYNLVHADEFFSTARERYEIKLRREAGQPWPWTKDKIFQEWRFTNVHREDDKTTVWFRENIREPLSQRYRIDKDLGQEICNIRLTKIVEATLIFRWFNRIETAQMIKDLLLYDWDTAEARERLTGITPIVTGAYIIKAGDGVSKLEGILNCIDEARPQLPRMAPTWAVKVQGDQSLERAWKSLRTLHFMGPFMAYEVVTDLRHTPVLENATDVMTWGNLGPGATRGMGYVVADDPCTFNAGTKDQFVMLELMYQLLMMSQDQMYWPQQWPAWEIHEVEMWLCEFCKFQNAKRGMRLKRRYKQ